LTAVISDSADARSQIKELAEKLTLDAQAAGAGFEDDPRYKALASGMVQAGGPAEGGPGELVEWLAREEYAEHSHARGGHNDRAGLRFARYQDA